MIFLLIFFLCQLSQYSSSTVRPLCHKNETSFLLQFKNGISIRNPPCSDSKIESWKHEGETSDCCKWGGVKCDQDSGRVIGLDISSSCLHGSINSNSSLFSLVHLESLNLSYNNFSYSEIPSGLGQLSRLTYLNLSNSFFSGQIPPEISKLSNLVSLDLSSNVDPFHGNLLELGSLSLRSLVHNMTKLEELDLSYVNISSTVPDIFVNMSSLTSLQLTDGGLHGDLPEAIFNLPNLKVLNLVSNQDLTGHLPDFPESSPLEKLLLSGTGFGGHLPTSIGNLVDLSELDISCCNFSGSLPPSLGNLTKLTFLSLWNNSFSGYIPSSLGNLAQLTTLSLCRNNFTESTISWLDKLTQLRDLVLLQINLVGEIPYFASLTDLRYLSLGCNNLRGHIPSWLMNFTHLTHLDLAFNQLNGPIPRTISNLKNLELLHLFKNNLSDTVELDMFVELRNLTTLQLSLNNITFIPRTRPNVTVQKFTALSLAACNLNEFPDFLRDQDELQFIDLAYNNISGLIPTWVWNTSKELRFVNFSHNFLTGFDQHPAILPWSSLGILDLGFNNLRGSLPIPSPSTFIYYVSNNEMSGEVSPLLCNLSSLYALDLSNNYLSGKLPPCLGSFSSSLTLLNLRNNKFQGTIPPFYPRGSRLKMVDLSQNQLHGRVPRSLVNCTALEFLILGDNQINDTFPHWVGTLPELKVLILRSNKFHGTIGSPAPGVKFTKLRIIDLSYNHFTGRLPSTYFQVWNAMKIAKSERLTYLRAIASFLFVGYLLNEDYDYSMSIMNKGIKTDYSLILDYFTAIDLSSNRFEGEIPALISDLKQLHLLNLSNNLLTGPIPPSLANLKELESLDLSQNSLSGQIPQQLTQLTFLEVLNVSHNHLTGRIPRGQQFDTFLESSFDGNPGLCGNQLPKKCTSTDATPQPPQSSIAEDDHDGGSVFEFNWMIIGIGYAGGLVVGVVMGQIFARRKGNWIMNYTFRCRQ